METVKLSLRLTDDEKKVVRNMKHARELSSMFRLMLKAYAEDSAALKNSLENIAIGIDSQKGSVNQGILELIKEELPNLVAAEVKSILAEQEFSEINNCNQINTLSSFSGGTSLGQVTDSGNSGKIEEVSEMTSEEPVNEVSESTSDGSVFDASSFLSGLQIG